MFFDILCCQYQMRSKIYVPFETYINSYLREIHTHNDNDRQTKSKITKKQQSIFYYLTNITNAIVTKDLSKQNHKHL